MSDKTPNTDALIQAGMAVVFARTVFDRVVGDMGDAIGDRYAVISMLFAAAAYAQKTGISRDDFERWVGDTNKLFRGPMQ